MIGCDEPCVSMLRAVCSLLVGPKKSQMMRGYNSERSHADYCSMQSEKKKRKNVQQAVDEPDNSNGKIE